MKSVLSLTSFKEVIEYWEQCLHLLDSGEKERTVASLMVNVVNNSHEPEWSEGTTSHPSYQLIFELAASLELPDNMTNHRDERWECIKALFPVLKKSIAERN